MKPHENEPEAKEDVILSSGISTEPLAAAMLWIKSGVAIALADKTEMQDLQSRSLTPDDTVEMLHISQAEIATIIRHALKQLMFQRQPTLRYKPTKITRALKQVKIPDFSAETTLQEIALVLNQTLLPECETNLTSH